MGLDCSDDAVPELRPLRSRSHCFIGGSFSARADYLGLQPGIVPPDHIFGTRFRYNEATGEVDSIIRAAAGWGKISVLEKLRANLRISHDHIICLGDGASADRPIAVFAKIGISGGEPADVRKEVMTLACQLALRPQKAAAETKLFDPADFIHQLVFLARVLLFIPHNSTLRFPVHIDSCGKARNWEDCGTACGCRHRFNLLFLKLHAFIRSLDQTASMQSQFHT
jgi:hypothetical protein